MSHLLTYTLLFVPTGLGFATCYIGSTWHPQFKRELILLGILCGLSIGLLAI